MTEHDELLLTILGRTDGTFWPVRNHKTTGRNLFFERRAAFLAHGIPWSSGGQRSAQREIESLAKNRQIVVFRSKGTRDFFLRLSDATDDRMRRLAGLAIFADSLALLDELYRMRSDGESCEHTGQIWTSEQRLTGVTWGDNERRGAYVALTCDLFPLLWRRLAESNSSMYGHCWYSLTDAGLKLARQRVKSKITTTFPADLAGDDGAYEFWRQARLAEVASIEGGRPAKSSELGGIPMPTCPARLGSRAARQKAKAAATGGVA